MLPAVRVLVVIPTFNEAENIARVIEATRRALPEAGILVVDDGSPDGTAERVEQLRSTHSDLNLLRRNHKLGLGSAYRAGFHWGMGHGFDVMVEMDADLSHDPGALPDLLAPIASGHEVAIGSRYVAGGSIPKWKLHRYLLSKGGNVYASVVLGLRVADSTAGFRAYAATLLSRITLETVRAEGYGFQIEMTYRARRAGASIVEVPIRFVDREVGESKMSSAIVVEALGLVTWWGLGRALRGAWHLVAGKREQRTRVPVARP
jgi:dolichol-phosphate mannosyltransferase